MSYRAPVADILDCMRNVGGLEAGIASGLYADLADGVAESVVEEAGKFAAERLAPLNRPGDLAGSKLVEGRVVTPPGFREAYRDWAAAGWAGLSAGTAYGGQGLPVLLNIACSELWNAANLSFALNPLLSIGAMEALEQHGSETLRAAYLPRLTSGEWTGTMNLTEPQAGSDLALLRTRAERAGDGSYRITGSKIYITYGDHDLTDNIVHLVLARLPDAPPGTRGISLFLVPKHLPNPDGSPGALNDLRCHSVEHKLGIHASPTCTMVFGDRGGAVGYLIGEENKGLACMFTMMNNARLNVGAQGVGLADRATQVALAYARERLQGRAPGAEGTSPIIAHPDVKRMLMEMRVKTLAARALCHATAAALDRAHRLEDEAGRRAALEEASLLTPVAKAFSTDIACEVTSTGVQVHGGMGFVEETGAAQFYRDARILPIYEGTNGIQAIDLVTRKLPLSDGRAVADLIARFRSSAEAAARLNDPAFARVGARLGAAIDSLERATAWLQAALPNRPADALAGATPYLRLFALAGGGAMLAGQALAAREAGEGSGRIREARFFAETQAVQAAGYEATVIEGGEAVNAAFLEAAE